MYLQFSSKGMHENDTEKHLAWEKYYDYSDSNAMRKQHHKMDIFP